MPVTINLMENDVIRDLVRKQRQEGRQEGHQQGHEEGEKAGAKREALTLLSRQLERRFGPLPEQAVARLQAADLATLENWGLRLLDASSLEEVLQSA
ncbi:MAG: DUF4351 domain-containing protein [Acidobacteria bacterium]|nr:DUF4351 domain-containing protein [Acidobacteriota bacterium]